MFQKRINKRKSTTLDKRNYFPNVLIKNNKNYRFSNRNLQKNENKEECLNIKNLQHTCKIKAIFLIYNYSHLCPNIYILNIATY